jgi:outer membrane receptor protein involved in Fe transport
VPYDIWNTGGVTQAALNYLQIPLVRQGHADQTDVLGTLTGDLGFTSPAAHTPIQTSFGFEYRRDAIQSDADTSFSSGDGAGQGGPTLGLSGHTDVFELFGEARIPLIEDAPFAELLSIDLAYRWSDYANGTQTDTYKIGGEWAPTEDVRLRASFQRAVRAPNIIELFAAQGAGLFDLARDPCDATTGSVPASCIGVNPWQVSAGQSASGNLDSPAGQYNGFFGGNPGLAPESSDTTTIGFVLQPRFIPGFTLSVDWFDIKIENTIATFGADNTLTACYVNLNAAACSQITRDPAFGALWVSGGQINLTNINIGGLETKGIDINANYALDMGGIGTLHFGLIGTWLDELVVDPGGGFTPYDCVGLFSGRCGTPNPEWRHRFRVGWETPWDLELDATWRHYGGVDNVASIDSGAPTDLDRSFDAVDYLDLAGNWHIRDNASIRFGVNNVLDKDPPISDNVGAGSGNGNTFPQVYDATGRYIFVGATVDF